MFVIASDNEPRYVELQKLWSSYMHSDPEHVEAYFLRADPSTQSKIEGDVVWSKTEECTIPGILIKTLFAFEQFQPRLKEFDFVIRTNLSSFYVFPQLLKYLETLPQRKCYAGPLIREGLDAASGCGIIFSTDVVELILKQKAFILPRRFSYYDDLVFWEALLRNQIYVIPSPLALVNTPEALKAFRADPIPEAFHFRVGYPEVYKELLDMFY